MIIVGGDILPPDKNFIISKNISKGGNFFMTTPFIIHKRERERERERERTGALNHLLIEV